MQLRHVGDGGTGIGTALSGTGQATSQPGEYTATYDCSGWKVQLKFTVGNPAAR